MSSPWVSAPRPRAAGGPGAGNREPADLFRVWPDLEGRLPAGELTGGDVEVGGARGDVDADDVAVSDQRQRPARGRFRRHFADHDALVHQARQLPVGDDGDLAGQPGTVEAEHEL